jgi:hypothetical protein
MPRLTPASSRRHWAAGLLLLALSLAATGCGKGVECDSCSTDDDCRAGLTCEKFDSGDKLCARLSTATCFKSY